MKISRKKRERILEQILALLYSITPKSIFTSYIAEEIARDEEFTKNLLLELKTKKLVVGIKKNPKGIPYLKRIKWKLSDAAYQAYKNHQSFTKTI